MVWNEVQQRSGCLQVGEVKLYLHDVVHELPSPSSWQLRPDLSRLHLDSTWLPASLNEPLNTTLPTRPILGLAWAERAPIYLQQPKQSVL